MRRWGWIGALALTVGLLGGARPAAAQTVYSSDFQAGITQYWNTTRITTDLNGKKTLGMFEAETAQLHLPNVPAGQYTLTFDFYTLHTWDGINPDGPDKFETRINGVTRIDAAFVSNPDITAPIQTYSHATPLGGGPFSGGVDNSGANILKYTRDSAVPVPNLRWTPQLQFSHAGGALTVDFIGKIDQPGQIYFGFKDESWTLDGVRITDDSVAAVPEPCSALLFLPALGVVALIKRRRV